MPIESKPYETAEKPAMPAAVTPIPTDAADELSQKDLEEITGGASSSQFDDESPKE